MASGISLWSAALSRAEVHHCHRGRSRCEVLPTRPASASRTAQAGLVSAVCGMCVHWPAEPAAAPERPGRGMSAQPAVHWAWCPSIVVCTAGRLGEGRLRQGRECGPCQLVQKKMASVNDVAPRNDRTSPSAAIRISMQ